MKYVKEKKVEDDGRYKRLGEVKRNEKEGRQEGKKD